MKTLVKVTRCICDRCNHAWYPKGEVKVCPKCKSPYWNTKKKEKKKHG